MTPELGPFTHSFTEHPLYQAQGPQNGIRHRILSPALGGKAWHAGLKAGD